MQVSKAKKVQVSPNTFLSIPTQNQATTKLGAVAEKLVKQTQATTLSVAAISGYVNAILTNQPPIVTFQDVPPGLQPSQLGALQDAYSTFQTQYASFKGQAKTWIDSSGGSTIFSQLVSVPTLLSIMKGTVETYFNDLKHAKGNDRQTVITALEGTIKDQKPMITTLNTAMQTLGTNLQNAATSLIASAKTGVLAQMQTAYQADIQTLINDINQCNSTISSDNKKIIGEGFGAATSIGVAVVGLMNFWNPVGWIMMGGGATGAYFAISEIETLKAQIAQLKTKISTDTSYKSQDKLAAQVLAAFINQLEGFAHLNQSAQQELAALENLYTTLSTDIDTAVADLKADEIDAAKAEWDSILSQSEFLKNLSAYIWPDATLLNSPSPFAAIGDDIYSLAVSGELYHYSEATNTWSDMGVKALSLAGAGSTLVAIDGAPIDGSSSGTPQVSSYQVKSYDFTTSQWSTISDFPAACIAEGGGTIYAVNQTVNDRQVYQYSGSGTTWTKLADLPNTDTAIQLAVANGLLFALACNSQLLYQYNASSSSWEQIATFTCASISANGSQLGIIDTNNNAYLYNATTGGTPTAFGASVATIAQLSTGNEFRMSSYSIGSLWYGDLTVMPATYTCYASDVTAVFASDTDKTYFVDNKGNMSSITTGGTITALPTLPTSSS
ncbi:MAG: hypothetical protein OXE99_11640 [Cellvibrionales bacterium]|nr:hypothetical protein [Cellvibrionales bacterium]